MTLKYICFSLLILSLSSGCKKSNDTTSTPAVEVPPNAPMPSYNGVTISTDKTAYNPGSEVEFTLDVSKLPTTAKVRYKYLNEVISEDNVTSETWKWRIPGNDFKGYLAEVYDINNGVETVYATIAIDVSSSWTRFPRYGFLSQFSQMSDAQTNQIVGGLNRYHINGLQFYDWQNKHHKPLPFNGNGPASQWKDIINRDIYFSTVSKYIDAAHKFNMKALFYNLLYGAWDDAENDGVRKEWYIYTDNTHTNKDFHPLSSPFLSNIYLLDPSNTAWQQYISDENKKVYASLPFDGYHIDQLGDRGSRYKYDGTGLNLPQTFKPFIDRMKADAPEKDLVMNAVNQYGQQVISQSPVSFLYTEVWSPFEKYSDLADLIKQNNTYSGNTRNTVLAAYMNYDIANSKGFFNTPAVLMTDAVIFAFGGSHIELGEHMLAKEYFPNDNLTMKDDLKSALINYYDFLVAYQNLLRDGGTFNYIPVSSADNKMQILSWPATQGTVACFGKQKDNKQVIQLINFKNSKTQNWRDNTAIQVAPERIKDAKLIFTSQAPVKKIWFASPDVIGGASRTLNFVQSGDKVNFTLPELQYWDMIVVEY